MQFSGKILLEGKVVVAHVRGSLDADERGGILEMRGLEMRDDYLLVLNNGRSAIIGIRAMSSGSSADPVVRFRVQGGWR